MSAATIEGTAQEKRLYDLIWKRTAASQMTDAEIEKTTVVIPAVQGFSFVATGEVLKFDGFMKVYRESDGDDDASADDMTHMLPPMAVGQTLGRKDITATERFSQGPARYTEASLVHKLEELGIGRPSTYAPTISTIQQREYVHKGDKKGEERPYTVYTLKGDKVAKAEKKEMAGSDKGKLLPTDVGTVVNDFLMKHFPTIMDYNFTANIEQKFDEIAEGEEKWTDVMKSFYGDFEEVMEKAENAHDEHRAGERLLGTDPKTGRTVMVKIGRFGPVVQIGTSEDEEKPLFAHVPSDKSIETITLDEALGLFCLPREIGEYDGDKVVIGTGRFGPYVLNNKMYVSLPKGEDPMSITLDTAIGLIEKKRSSEQQKHIKQFAEEPKLEVLNGRYGPYIAYKGKNYRLPKSVHERAAELTLEECMDIVKAAPTSTRKRTGRA